MWRNQNIPNFRANKQVVRCQVAAPSVETWGVAYLPEGPAWKGVFMGGRPSMSLLGAPETHPNDPSPIPREQEEDAFLLHSEPFPEALSHLTGRRLCLILLLGMACSFPLYSFFFFPISSNSMCLEWIPGSLWQEKKKRAWRGNVRAVIHCNTLGETASNFHSIDPPWASKPHWVYLEN